MREVITNYTLIGFAIGGLVTFGFIAINGGATITEPNSGVLYGEIALMIAIIALGVYNLVKIYRR